MEANELRDFIQRQQCPFCDSEKTFIVLAAHVVQAHGISAYEFREMAGLNRGTSICDPDYSLGRAEQQRRRDPKELRAQLAMAHTPEVIAGRDLKMRPEGRAKQLAWLTSPRRLELSLAVLHTPEAMAKSKLKAQNRSPEVAEAQTKRVAEANRRWLATHTKEEIAERSRRGYRTLVKRAGEQAIGPRFRALGLMAPHDSQVKGAAAAAIAIPIYHADPEWKAMWRRNMEEANRKRAKVSHTHFPEIARRYWSGESPTKIASDYGISRAWVRKIAKRVRLNDGGEI